VGSNTWVGLSVCLFTHLSFAPLATGIAIWYPVLVGLATIVGYGYMRWVQVWQGNHLQNTEAHQWFLKHKREAAAIMLIAALLGFLVFYLIYTDLLLLWLVPAILIVIIYPLSFPRAFSSFSALRSVPGLKLFLISAAWAYLTYALPFLLQGLALSPWFWGEMFFRIVFVAALIIPFDVRDLAHDAQNLQTIPQLTGPQTALNLAGLGLGIYQFWYALRFALGEIPFIEMLGWVVGLEIGIWLVKSKRVLNNKFYVAFWVEGIPLFLTLVILLFTYVF
jgi:4-hydroxybenzoate polyprenyltransferase